MLISQPGNYFLQHPNGLSGLASLIYLRKLDLSSNQIKNPEVALPQDIFYLTNLQELLIPHNDLPNIPSDIAWLSNLTIADFSYNQFSELPPEIGSLPYLKKLLIHHNRLVSLPEELANLTNLTELDASYNELTSIPPSYSALYLLTTLNLSFNHIADIPTELFGGGEPLIGEDGQAWVQGMFALKDLKLRQNCLSCIFYAILA